MTSNAVVRPNYSKGMVSLIAISVIILFPLLLLGIYTLVYLKKKPRRDKEQKELEERVRAASQES